MTSNALAVISSNESALALAKEYKRMLPGGEKLTDSEAQALAIYSTAHGFDPYNGECYFLAKEKKDETGRVISRESIGVYPGIKGVRKIANKQLHAVDPASFYHIDYQIIPAASAGALLGIDITKKPVAIAVEATLTDSISRGRWIADVITLVKGGVPYEAAAKMIGPEKKWVGYGVVYKNEYYIKMTPLELAKKRGETSATKQRFDLPFDVVFGVDIAENANGSPVIDVVDSVDAPYRDAPQPTERKSFEKLVGELYGEITDTSNVHDEEEPEAEPITPAEVMAARRKLYTGPSAEILFTMKDSVGNLYAELDNDILNAMVAEIDRAIKKNGLDENAKEQLASKRSIALELAKLGEF